MINLPWKLIGYVAGAAAALTVLWWVQSRIRVSYQAEHERDTAIAQHAAYKDLVQTSAIRAAARLAQDQADDAGTARALEQLENDNERLRAAAARIHPVEEKPDANGVAHSSVSGDWWLCQTAFVTRDPTDSATCEAHGGAAGLPYAVGDRRVQVPPAVLESRAR